VSLSKFEINRKKYGLTYSCPVHLERNPIESKEDLLSFLEGFGPLDHIVALEPHKSGKAHFHVFAKYEAAIRSKDPHIFDYKGVHPNILKPGRAWEGYCVKHEDYITNYYERGTFKRAAEADTWTEAADILWQREPKFMLQYGDACERNWKRRKKAPIRDPIYYGPAYKGPDGWDPSKEALIITGPSRVGKTQWALDWARHNGGEAMRCNHYQKLKQYNDQPCLIWDDADDNLNPQDCSTWISLTTTETSEDFRVLHGVVTIPAIPKIFCTNGALKPVDNAAGAVKARTRYWDFPVFA
jgi:hypothetical protein